MIIVLIIFFSVTTILFGRWMFDRWFNHVSIYSVAWGGSLAFFQTGLIQYYPLQIETWMVIMAGWIAFVFGSSTVVMSRYAIGVSAKSSESIRNAPEEGLQGFRILLWILNGVILLEAIHHAVLISHLVGGLNHFTQVANIVYHLRTEQGIPGMIPYLSSTAFAACLLAGVFISRMGKLQFVSFIPLLVIIVDSVLNMSRGDLIFGGILFACGYIISEKKKTTLLEKVGTYRLRRVITAILALILFVVGLEFVRSNRGIVEGYGTTATKLTKLKDVSFITPSVLFYVSGHYGVLNQYFKTQNEKVVVGAYSLAPFWRLISKLGFPVNIKPFQPFYNTPFQGNNGTYLRELHADYGLAGIVAGPYFLGAIASWFWFRARQSQKILDLMILGHILFVVAMSIFLFATQWGSWLVSLLFGMTVAYWIDHFHAIKVDEKIKLIT